MWLFKLIFSLIKGSLRIFFIGVLLVIIWLFYLVTKFDLDREKAIEFYQINRNFLLQTDTVASQIEDDSQYKIIQSKWDNQLPDVTDMNRVRESESKIRRTIEDILKQYDTDGLYLFREYYRTPLVYAFPNQRISFNNRIDYTQYLKGYSHSEVIRSIPTIVHELCHGYNSLLRYKEMKNRGIHPHSGNYDLYYLSRKQSQLVPRTQVFNTSRVHRIIPEELQTFRYMYVYPSKGLSSHINGLYGLVEEWNAYYHGTKAAVNLFSHFAQLKDPVRGYLGYLQTMNNQYLAYLEFKFYVFKYLQFARQYQFSVYEDLISNRQLIRVITHIDKNYKETVQEHFNHLNQICKDVNNKGIACKKTEEGIQIGNTSFNLYMKAYSRLNRELDKERYRPLWDLILDA